MLSNEKGLASGDWHNPINNAIHDVNSTIAVTSDNEKMIDAVFTDLNPGAYPLVVSFPEPPGEHKDWTGRAVKGPVSALVKPGHNQYICAASVHCAASGRGTNANYDIIYFIILDDIGELSSSKVHPDRSTLPPTAIVETSADNCQHWYVFDKPQTYDDTAILLKMIADAGLTDKNGNNPNRWVRLPDGVNSKPEAVEHWGSPFPCKLHKWAPERRYSPQAIVDGLGLTTPTLQAVKPVAALPAAPSAAYDQSAARKLARDCAMRTRDNPILGRHAEIYTMGGHAARDGLPLEALAYVLDEFIALARDTNTAGHTEPLDRAKELATIRDGYQKELADAATRIKPDISQFVSAIKATDDGDVDYLQPPPQRTPAMFYGLVGDVARAGARGKEVNEVAVGAAYISWLSAMVGSDIYLPIGDTEHSLNLFLLHVGRTASGGKGESIQLTRRLDAYIRADHAQETDVNALGPLGKIHTGGLSTREGLATLIHDGFKRTNKEEEPAVEDKRLWVFEPEFQNVLSQNKREGNTLSSALRDVFDGGSIKPATKSQSVWATDPHIALHGGITPGELRQGLESREITNGFANRFLIFWAERTRLVPNPQPTDATLIKELGERTKEVIALATGGFPHRTRTSRHTRRMTMTPAAAALWEELYGPLKARDPSETVTALLERRAPITVRLAGIFAVTDLTVLIDERHLAAAYAWSQYHQASVRWVFSDQQERQQGAEVSLRRRKITDYLQGRDWVLRSEIQRAALSGNVSAKAMDVVLQAMLADGHLSQKDEPRAGAVTTTKKLYRLVRQHG